MLIIGIVLLVISILGFLVCGAIYITCLGISKMLERMMEVQVRNEKRKSINITNKELLKK